jgi:hypothetical protein
MRAEDLAAEFGIAGVLAFVEAEHGFIHQPQQRIRAGKGDPRRHPDRLPVVRSQSADADCAAARLRTHRRVASRRSGNRGQRVAHL